MNKLKTPKQHAFTLAELMVGLTLGVMVLAGVLTAYIFFCRTGVAIAQYYDMEDESRTTMQIFGQDVRQAKAINWNDTNSISLALPDNSTLTYAFIGNTKTFRRTKGNSVVTLASGIDSFAFKAYSASNLDVSTGPTEISLASVADSAPARTAANSNTNMVRIQIVLRRNAGSQVYSTAQAITAAYVLRNKSGG